MKIYADQLNAVFEYKSLVYNYTLIYCFCCMKLVIFKLKAIFKQLYIIKLPDKLQNKVKVWGYSILVNKKCNLCDKVILIYNNEN